MLWVYSNKIPIYTPYSIYLRGTIGFKVPAGQNMGVAKHPVLCQSVSSWTCKVLPQLQIRNPHDMNHIVPLK